MRKVYVLYGWTPQGGIYVSGIFSSKRKAEHAKNVLEKARKEMKETQIYKIETEDLL